MMKVPPMMVTFPTRWNILVDETACGGGCVSVANWLVDCCGRRRVMNVSKLCKHSMFLGKVQRLGGWRVFK